MKGRVLQVYEDIQREAYMSTKEIIEKAGMTEGKILVVGCSTSEVCGKKIGTSSSIEVANALFEGIFKACSESRVFLAVQCCEHLNRAIIIERDSLPFAEEVNVIPQQKAGGSFAVCAYNAFKNPIAIEEIKADAGLDIGRTLIGMHLRRVAVPVRLENDRIGEATVVAARTRPRFIGGPRAVYFEA